MKETKVYVGDLDDFATEKELRDAFEQFGNVTHVWVSKKPPGFAFVSMTNYEDAEDAVRGLDGSYVLSTVSHCIRLNLSRTNTKLLSI